MSPSPSTPYFQRRAHTVFSASTVRATLPSCAPSATAMATSSCAAAKVDRTTIPSASRWPRRRSKKPSCQPNIIVDCSHANSFKKAELQPLVMSDVVNQIRLGNQSLVGVMIESNLVAGNQPIPRRPLATEIRLLGHRRVHRLGRHRKNAARSRRTAARRATEEKPLGKEIRLTTTRPLIRPFTGLRPRTEHAAAVAAPPYDVLSSDVKRGARAPPANPTPSCTFPRPRSICRRKWIITHPRFMPSRPSNLQKLDRRRHPHSRRQALLLRLPAGHAHPHADRFDRRRVGG